MVLIADEHCWLSKTLFSRTGSAKNFQRIIKYFQHTSKTKTKQKRSACEIFFATCRQGFNCK